MIVLDASLAHWNGVQPYSDENTSRGNLVMVVTILNPPFLCLSVDPCDVDKWGGKPQFCKSPT